jgi:hypothetical protein
VGSTVLSRRESAFETRWTPFWYPEEAVQILGSTFRIGEAGDAVSFLAQEASRC